MNERRIIFCFRRVARSSAKNLCIGIRLECGILYKSYTVSADDIIVIICSDEYMLIYLIIGQRRFIIYLFCQFFKHSRRDSIYLHHFFFFSFPCVNDFRTMTTTTTFIINAIASLLRTLGNSGKASVPFVKKLPRNAYLYIYICEAQTTQHSSLYTGDDLYKKISRRYTCGMWEKRSINRG